MENKNQLPATMQQQPLSICKVKDLSELVKLCHLADANFKLVDSEVQYITSLIVSEYPDMIFETFKNIITEGIKGKLDAGSYQQPINSRTIFGWIEKYNEKNKSLTSPKTSDTEITQWDIEHLPKEELFAKHKRLFPQGV